MIHETDRAVALRDLITGITLRADPHSMQYDPSAVYHTPAAQQVAQIVQAAIQHLSTYDSNAAATVYGRSNMAAHMMTTMVTEGEGQDTPRLTIPFEERIFDFLFYDLSVDYSVHGQNGKSWEDVEAMLATDYRDALYVLNAWFAQHGRLWTIWQTLVEQYHSIWQEMPHPQYHQCTKDTMRNTLAIYVLTRVDDVLQSDDTRVTNPMIPWGWRAPLMVEQIVQSVQSNAPLLTKIHQETYYDHAVAKLQDSRPTQRAVRATRPAPTASSSERM